MTSSPLIPGPPHPPEQRSQRGESTAPIPQPEASPRASSSPIPQPAAPSTCAPIPSPPASGDSMPEQGQTHSSVRLPQTHDARAGRSFPQTGIPTPVASAPAAVPQASSTSGFAPQASGTSGFAPQAVGAPQGAPTQFTPAFQRFVDAGPSMPAPGAVQYPQVAPQAVHTWALPTTAKKLPVFEASVVGAGLALMLVGMYSYLAVPSLDSFSRSSAWFPCASSSSSCNSLTASNPNPGGPRSRPSCGAGESPSSLQV